MSAVLTNSVARTSSVILRDYQKDMIDRARLSLRKCRRVLIQAPTGSGKTVLASHIAESTSARGQLTYFNVHRVELARGTSNTFSRYGIKHGFIASRRKLTDALVQICSIDTLKNRLATTPEPRVALWDECKHLGAAGWRMVMDAWPNAIHIGLDATPWRLDGSGLGDCFQDMVLGPTTAWLMERGFLSQYEIFAPTTPNMKGARKQGGDFTSKDASDRMEIPKRTGDIIKHWRLHAEGLRTIGFAVNVADSLILVQRFNEAGIPAAHLDGKTPKGERKKIIDAFARGEILVLFNVALFDEGFDLASIAEIDDLTVDCLIDAAPTLSLARVLQRWGRVLRAKLYAAIILDHAGNCTRHGFPDDEREWTLDDREKCGNGGAAGPPPPVDCPGCFRQLRRPLPDYCPTCRHKFEAGAGAPLIVATEGNLEKLTAEHKAALRREREIEEFNAKTLEQLVALAFRRGYAQPHAWAFKKWSRSKTRQRYANRGSSLA